MPDKLAEILALRLRERECIAAAIQGYWQALREMTILESHNEAQIARLEREIQHGKEN